MAEASLEKIPTTRDRRYPTIRRDAAIFRMPHNRWSTQCNWDHLPTQSFWITVPCSMRNTHSTGDIPNARVAPRTDPVAGASALSGLSTGPRRGAVNSVEPDPTLKTDDGAANQTG